LSHSATSFGHFDVTIFESAPFVGGKLAIYHDETGLVYPYNDTMQYPITAEDIAGNALMWSNPLFTKDSEEALRDEIDFVELESQQVG
jgi:hypothetical protein